MKKTARDIIILQMWTKNHNHMWYGSWDTKWDRHNFFVILGIFCPLPPAPLLPPPLTTLKIKTLNTWKKHLGCLHLQNKWQSEKIDLIIPNIHVYQKSQSHDVCFLRYHFSAPFQLTSAENGKAVELKYVNYAGDETFSFDLWFPFQWQNWS